MFPMSTLSLPNPVPQMSARKTTAPTRAQRGSYHHGDLRNALIDAALARIAIDGARS